MGYWIKEQKCLIIFFQSEECEAMKDEETSILTLLYYRGTNKVMFLMFTSLGLCALLTILGKMGHIFYLHGDAKQGDYSSSFLRMVAVIPHGL